METMMNTVRNRQVEAFKPIGWWLGGALGLLAGALWFYAPVLFAPAGTYPWAPDTLGHVLKATYLAESVAQGVWYPDLFPGWYMGLQMLRYYPPAAYYLIAALAQVAPNMLVATNWLMVGALLVGACGWLLYRRWLGMGWALVGGALYLILPDNVRVAFADGNVPRVVAIALLPWLLFAVLRALEPDGRARHLFIIAVGMALTVLSHAMMAAIYAAMLALLSLAWVMAFSGGMRRALRVIAALVIGIMLSGWWLFPSLTGGITDIDTTAMTEALAVVPIAHYFDPRVRLSDIETMTVGAFLLMGALMLLLWRRRQSPAALALVSVGFVGILLSTPRVNTFYNALPMHSLLWPARFLGIASTFVLFGVLWYLRDVPWRGRWRVVPVVLLLLVCAEFMLGRRLVFMRPLSPDLEAVVSNLAQTPGWRVATLDHSALGSKTSYWFAVQGREQVFGWAYQGATTARTVAALNEALQTGFIPYVLSRLDVYGVDDVVVLKRLPTVNDVMRGLQGHGFQRLYDGEEIALYHRDGEPRAFVVEWQGLGIGRGAQNAAYIFPSIVMGTSPYLDDYTLDELTRYPLLVLSGFQWHDKQRAEALVRDVARAGVRVVIDLTGTPPDPMASIPHFLDVWGEPVVLDERPVPVNLATGETMTLSPFGTHDGEKSILWYTHTPQGLSGDVATTSYIGEKATLVGYKDVDGGRVWFVGYNLFFYTLARGDVDAIHLLEEATGLTAHALPVVHPVPLQAYKAGTFGYRFTYTLETPQTLFVPIAAHDRWALTLDDAPSAYQSYERLLVMDAPAGTHQVALRFQPPPIYTVGRLVSLAGVVFLFVLLWYVRRTPAERPLWPTWYPMPEGVQVSS
ncbi:hypothetical protein ARMA_0427 [Ardenticatena maritima]|uniref:Membrane protein 6-pyruvoyl-tetrahydropterin synthase-related domain-containing protein n=2 Tax=Ardenticatena maritima TaxID=872965 RepID=A0A0M9UBM2_9CHLR|nr:hypothetical protein ARMA_0427 [Ardenticatena maritima]